MNTHEVTRIKRFENAGNQILPCFASEPFANLWLLLL